MEAMETIPAQKVLAVIKALYQGLEVKLEGYTFRLGRNDKDHPILTMKLLQYHNSVEDGEPLWVGSDDSMPFSIFLRACEQLTDDYVTIMQANTALNQIKRPRRAK